MLTVNMNPPENTYINPVSTAGFGKTWEILASLGEGDSSY